MASQNVIKLANRLKEEFGIIVDPESYYTTRAGKHLRAGGAFLWMFLSGTAEVGGCEPMKKYIVKRNRLDIYVGKFKDIEIFAYAPGEPGYELDN